VLAGEAPAGGRGVHRLAVVSGRGGWAAKTDRISVRPSVDKSASIR
jgi:hypothetical protein